MFAETLENRNGLILLSILYIKTLEIFRQTLKQY